MADIHDKLRELLENPKLREALAKAFYTDVDSPSGDLEIDLADRIRRSRGERMIASTKDLFGPFVEGWIEGVPKKLNDAIQARVIENLPAPSPITSEELTSIAIAQLAGVPLQDSVDNEEVTRAYSRFVTFALSEIEEERLGTTYFDLGRWLCEDDGQYDEVYPGSGGVEIWSSCSGFSLNTFAADKDLEIYANMVGELRAHCSKLAMTRAEE